MEKLLLKEYLNKENIVQDQIDDLILELIKERKKMKITQTMLSKMTGIPQTTISRVESFSTIPTLTVLIKLSAALKMSLSFQKND